MKSFAFALLAVCALFSASALARRPSDEAQRLLQGRVNELRAEGRRLRANSAYSSASGGQTASASATAGPGGASTQQSATGGNAQVAGVSQVNGKVDSCQRGPANSAACQTLTTADRSSGCTDIPPSTEFTCPEQFRFGKCDADFIYSGAFCLRSCNRCGGNCVDRAPAGGSCAADQCDSPAYLAGPYCLKTCNRCTTAAA